MPSAGVAICNNMLAAICMIGIENCREYWMNAWTSPSDIVPLATRRPPNTAIAT